MGTFLLEIITPEQIVFAQQVEAVSVKGIEGELGILAHHIPLVTPLRVGSMKIKMAGKEHLLAVHSGFVEVRTDKVVVLAESAELPEQIDIERAKAAQVRAEQRLTLAAQGKQTSVDFRRAELSLQRAITRIKVVRK